METAIANITDINATHNETNNELVYKNYSVLKIEDAEQSKLQEPINLNEIEIKPDGLIYLPQVFYRQKLNDTFGIGQWALVIHRDMQQDNMLFIDGSLYVRGCFVARAMGEQHYIESNKNQSWAAVWESAKSDCITRCCKDLGIAKELWSPQFIKNWIAVNAIKVWVDKKPKWRKYDSEPFYKETGICEDSPNKDKYKMPQDTNSRHKQNDKPKQRNYTAESKECSTLESLYDWARTKLTKQEAKSYSNLLLDRESEIIDTLLDKVKTAESLQVLYNSLTKNAQVRYKERFNERKNDFVTDAVIIEETDKDMFGNVSKEKELEISISKLTKKSNFEAIDASLADVKDSKERARLAKQFYDKIKELGVSYEVETPAF